MKYRIRFRPAVAKDLQQASDWYDRQRIDLGKEFLAAAYQAFDDLQTRPLSFPTVYQAARRALMRRFPYAIYFRVEDASVIVFAVIHTARAPRTWQRRR